MSAAAVREKREVDHTPLTLQVSWVGGLTYACSITLFAMGIISFTGALTPTTLGIVMLSCTGVSIALHLYSHYQSSNFSADLSWKITALSIFLGILPYLVAGTLGVAGIASGQTMGFISLSTLIAINGLVLLCFVPHAIYKRCRACIESDPSRMGPRLAEAYTLRTYFVARPEEKKRLADMAKLSQSSENQMTEEELFQKQMAAKLTFQAVFFDVLRLDQQFQKAIANSNEYVQIRNSNFKELISRYNEQKDLIFRSAMSCFLERHDSSLKVFFQCALEGYF
jgi:hypothetical protein